MRQYGVKLQRIRQIFISHLHGDHYFGLPGLLTSMSLLGREKELQVFAPKGIVDIIQTNFRYSKTKLNFPCAFHELEEGKQEMIYEDERITVSCFPLNHRIPTFGYLFREKRRPSTYLVEEGRVNDVPMDQIPKIKAGADFVKEDGSVILNEQLTEPSAEPESYAYCSDTGFYPNIVNSIQGIELLYHEATFMEDMKKRAEETFHSTAKQAAAIAQRAQVRQLLIGHFSTRYDELEGLLNEAREVFPKTNLALEGEVYSTGA